MGQEESHQSQQQKGPHTDFRGLDDDDDDDNVGDDAAVSAIQTTLHQQFLYYGILTTGRTSNGQTKDNENHCWPAGGQLPADSHGPPRFLTALFSFAR